MSFMRQLSRVKTTSIAAAAVLGLCACSTAPRSQPLTDQAFEAAKQNCGAIDAYVIESSGRPIVTFRGEAPDFETRQAQAECLKRQLKGTDVRFIAFISEPPR